MEQYWRRGWQSGFIKFNTPHTVKPDERVCISIYIDFSISRNCRPFSLLVVMEMLSLIISAIVIVSLFYFEKILVICCVASHIAGVTLVSIWIREVTLTSVPLQSSAMWGFPFINVIQFLKVTEENYMSNLKGIFFLEKKGIFSIMKVAQLRLQQDQKWLITSNCLQREADYHILRVSGLNCYLWAEFQWTLVLIKCIGCWYFHHAGVTFEEKARHLTLRESNLVICSFQRGFSGCGQPY